MGKVPGYKVRIRGSRRELVWKGDEEDEEDLGMLEDRTGPPDMRIRASRRELVWGVHGENDEDEEKEEDEEGARRKEEDLYYGGQKIKHFKSKDELPNSRAGGMGFPEAGRAATGKKSESRSSKIASHSRSSSGNSLEKKGAGRAEQCLLCRCSFRRGLLEDLVVWDPPRFKGRRGIWTK